jgi:hypothetical protein
MGLELHFKMINDKHPWLTDSPFGANFSRNFFEDNEWFWLHRWIIRNAPKADPNDGMSGDWCVFYRLQEGVIRKLISELSYMLSKKGDERKKLIRNFLEDYVSDMMNYWYIAGHIINYGRAMGSIKSAKLAFESIDLKNLEFNTIYYYADY